MTDELRTKLEQRMNRRSFLKGSSLAAAALMGIALFPAGAGAQDQQTQKTEDKPKDGDDKAAGDQKTENTEKKDPNAPTEDEFKVTKKDENGREYRICPQCGYNMYRQDRTWTCENCGFSYTE